MDGEEVLQIESLLPVAQGVIFVKLGHEMHGHVKVEGNKRGDFGQELGRGQKKLGQKS